MSESRVFAIGDLQGCLDDFQRLLDKIRYEPAYDQLWLAGDLVNRGPASLETLRYVKALSDAQPSRVVSVLGNHDLHLLAMAYGARQFRDNPWLRPITQAEDCDELVEWLRHCPLIHRDADVHAVLVHAGIFPAWRIKQAVSYAAEVEAVLQGSRVGKLLKKMYGKRPAQWQPDLSGWDRYRFIINACTRMRYIGPRQALNFSSSVSPGKQGKRLTPWYQIPPVSSHKNWRIVFGHWSSAGAWFDGNHIALDSGCVWGEMLTAARIDQRRIRLTSIACPRS